MKRQFQTSIGSWLGAFFLTMVFASSAWCELSFSSSTQIHLQADTIEYLKASGIVMATGQVHIQQKTIHLYADKVRYDLNAQSIQASGHVVWQDSNQEIEADSLNFDLKTKQGKAYRIRTTTPPWISIGSEVDIEPDKIIIKNAMTTTCDDALDYQHYSMRADTITLFSGDFMVAQNVVLYIGKVPVFYFPFFVRTIHDFRTPFSVSTGSTDYLGNYVLLTVNYLFNPQSYGALYTDYFSKKGFGLGVHHEIALNDDSVLSLYGYGIQEDHGHFRWESRIRGLWALSSDLQGRVEMDMPGDGLFSEDYSVARRDPSLVSTQREYDISATYARQQYTLGLLLRRQESPNPSDINEISFQRTLQNLPQLSFTLSPQALIGRNWLKYDLTFQGDHTIAQPDDYYVNHLSGELGISQNILFLETQNLYSRVAWDEQYQDVSDVNESNSGEIHSVNANNTWAARWTDFCDTNLQYTFSKQLNRLSPASPLGGVTSDLLSGYLEFISGSLLRTRTSTSFDFQTPEGTLGARFSYLRQEVYITPSAFFNYLGIVDYSIQANALKDLNTVLNLKNENDFWNFRISGNYVDPNVSNTGPTPLGLPPTFEISGEIDLNLFTNYRISALETYDLTNSKYETRSVGIYRDLHDWEAELSYTQDPVEGNQFFFTLDLKAFPGRPLSVSNDQIQRLNGLRSQGLTGTASQFQ